MSYLCEGEGRRQGGAEEREKGTASLGSNGPSLRPPPLPRVPYLAMMGGVSMRPMGHSTW